MHIYRVLFICFSMLLLLLVSGTQRVVWALPPGEPTVIMVEHYELPYPGILPNHPLYPLKLVRDRMLDFLIRDPVKRINFYVLMADKRLNMGVYLTDEKEYVLAEETVSKGEKYLDRAIDALYEATEAGRDLPPDMTDRITVSSAKHQFVITQIRDKNPEKVHAGYSASLSTAAENSKRIGEFGK